MKATFIVLVASVAWVTTAHAQSSKPRVGYAGTPKQDPAPVVQPQPLPPVYYPSGGGGYLITGAPYVVLTDGSVLVNFGSGYERVFRQCAQQNSVTRTNPNGLDALGRVPLPLNAPLRSGDRGQIGGTMPERNVSACYRVNEQRKAELVRG